MLLTHSVSELGAPGARKGCPPHQQHGEYARRDCCLSSQHRWSFLLCAYRSSFASCMAKIDDVASTPSCHFTSSLRDAGLPFDRGKSFAMVKWLLRVQAMALILAANRVMGSSLI